MFKRPHSTKASNLISTSARKKLIQQAQAEFFTNDQTITPEEQNQIIHQIIPPIINVTKAYTHLNHQLFIYHDNHNQPIWIKLDKGNGRLVPTVYTLLKYPTLLPILRTNRIVLDKLSQGADLMIPGLVASDLQSIQNLKKDALVSIVPTDSTHLVWAVGFLAADGSLIATSQSGKAVITVHSQTDYLWNSGTKEIPDRIESIPATTQSHSNTLPEPTEQAKAASELNHDQLEKLSIHQQGENVIILNQSPQEDQRPTTPDVTHHTEDLSALSVSCKLSSTEVDHILKQALLMSLWNQKVASEIPMPGSQFYSDFILPFRHFECPKSVGVKDSSAKNLAKWLRTMNKFGLITIKEDHKKRTETLVTGVNLDHPELEQFRKYRTIHDQEKLNMTKNKDEQDDNAHQNPSNALDVDSCLFKLPETKIIAVFKARKNEGGWFWLTKIDLDPEQLYTQQEIKGNLIKYINETVKPTLAKKKEGKKTVDMSLVEPDDYLRSAMVVEARKKWPDFDRKGEVPNIVLKMKKKSGTKQSTLIAGLEFFGIDPIRFAKELKTLCAGSSTTRPIAIDPNGYNKVLKELLNHTKITNLSSLMEVECQGDQRQFLSNFLSSNTPIPKTSIQVI